MRSIVRLALPAMVLALSVTPAPAQTPLADRSGTARGLGAGACCLSKLSAAEEALIAQRLEEAGSLLAEGRWTEARTILRNVIGEQRRGDANTGVALRRLAIVEFSLDRPLVAAGVLVELADEARRVGDPITEMQALLDADAVYRQEGETERASVLYSRARRLPDSRTLSDDTRSVLAGMLKPL